MVTLITVVKNAKDFKQLKKNLSRLEADWNIGLDFLCLVKDKNLFLECREFLTQSIDRRESLVVYDDKASLKKGIDYLGDKNKYVFLLREGVILPNRAITRLYQDYILRPSAGFISGKLKNHSVGLWLNDIYDPSQFLYCNDYKPGLIEIDTTATYGILTKTQLYKDLFCQKELIGTHDLSFGIRLKRLGYKNYIDTTIEYGDEL